MDNMAVVANKGQTEEVVIGVVVVAIPRLVSHTEYKQFFDNFRSLPWTPQCLWSYLSSRNSCNNLPMCLLLNQMRTCPPRTHLFLCFSCSWI